MKRRRFLSLTAPAGAAATWGCRPPAAHRQRPKIRVLSTPYLGTGTLYMAHEQGFFTQEGLDVELIETARSLDGVALLVGGKAEAACMSIGASVINAVARGAALRVVAAREQVLPRCGDAGALYARRSVVNGPVGGLAWLKAKRIAISYKASFAEYALDMILEKGGLRPEDVKTVLLPRQEAAAALEGGKIDAMINNDLLSAGPLNSPAIVRVTSLGDVVPGYQYSFVLFGGNLLQGGTEVGVRFLRALHRGYREFVAGATPQFMKRMAGQGEAGQEILRRLCRGTCVVDGRLDKIAVQRTLDWMAGKGYCERKLDVQEIVDMRFLDELGKGDRS